MLTAAEALAALRALPCGARALDVLAEHPEAWLVGGAVRDALLGRLARGHLVDIDVVVEGDPEPVAAALGEIVAVHERFGTYDVVGADGCVFDVVRARREHYPLPGALPEVEPAGLEEDLLRRDFTVNALALNAAGELHAAPAALEDLEAGRLRVLHAASFRDDPTRLWRLVRYALRLSFTPEPATERIAVEAVRGGALERVSDDRIGTELRLTLAEIDPLAVLHAAQSMGIVEGLEFDPARVTNALALLPPHGRDDLVMLGATLPDADWPVPYGFTAGELRILQRCAVLEPVEPAAPSEVVARLRGEPVEAVAVAGARGDREIAGMYLHVWRHVVLEIDGHDLIAAGLPEGPDIGRRLAVVLARRLDGDLPDGREAELAAALAATD